MPTMNMGSTASAGGMSIASSVARTFDSVQPIQPNQPTGFAAGKTVTSWVKTDADTAACNLPGGHGYTTGTFDVYWTESGVYKRRYGVPGTVTVNALALDGGTGDSFPASATSGVIVTKQSAFSCPFDGDGFKALAATMEITGATAGGRGSLTFFDAADSEIAHFDLPMNAIDVDGGNANPFEGEVVSYAVATNGSTSQSGALKLIIGSDSTP